MQLPQVPDQAIQWFGSSKAFAINARTPEGGGGGLEQGSTIVWGEREGGGGWPPRSGPQITGFHTHCIDESKHLSLVITSMMEGVNHVLLIVMVPMVACFAFITRPIPY